MEIALENYDQKKHFPLVFKWWRKHRGVSVDINAISPVGLVAYAGEDPLAIAWLFLSNSKLAQIGWPVTNPDSPLAMKSEAVELLIEALGLLAKNCGYKRLITFSSSNGLTRKFEKQGFTKMMPHDVLIKAIE